MAQYKQHRNRTIDDEIALKIDSINTVRVARIKASERLYKYSDSWDFLFFCMNILSVALLVVSLLPMEVNNSKSGLMVSALFSLYTMLVQYYCSTQNYNERALKYHYHQLELENFILQLKNLFLSGHQNRYIKHNLYKNIVEKYQISLQGYENHSDLDYRIAKRQKKSYERQQSSNLNYRVIKRQKKTYKIRQSSNSFGTHLYSFFYYRDFSLDNIFIKLQIPVMLLVVVAYSLIAMGKIK